MSNRLYAIRGGVIHQIGTNRLYAIRIGVIYILNPDIRRRRSTMVIR